MEPHEEVEVDTLPVSTINVLLGNKHAKDDLSVIGDNRSPSEPFGQLIIAANLLAIAGIGCGVGAGMFTERSDNNLDESGDDQSPDTIAARAMGCLSVGAFLAAIPMVFCAALAYQNSRGSRGLPDVMLYAWIMFGIGIANVVLLLITSMITASFSQTFWVHFATLYNIVPFTMMMIHAEACRKY